jgi:hypothetical protein
MEYRLRPNRSSTGWAYLEVAPRHRVQVLVAVVAETGKSIVLGQEAADMVLAWIHEIGWKPQSAPVVLEPIRR